MVQQSSRQLSLRMRYFSFDNALIVFICNVELKGEQDPAVSVGWNVMRGKEMVEYTEKHDLSLTLPVMLPSVIMISSKLSFLVLDPWGRWSRHDWPWSRSQCWTGHIHKELHNNKIWTLKAVAIEMLITAVLVMIVFAAAADQLNSPGVKVSTVTGQFSCDRDLSRAPLPWPLGCPSLHVTCSPSPSLAPA